MQTQQLLTLMRLSWKIQHSKKTSRSKSLVSAWVIYLVKKHTPAQRTTGAIDKNLKLIF